MKKTFKRVLALMMAMTSLTVSMGSLSTNAANVTDTSITSFTAPPSISNTFSALPTSQNGVRVKETNTSVYLYITSSPYSVFVQTWGLSDTMWSSAVANRTCNSSGSSTSYVTVAPGSRYVIKNLINERGDTCAGLKFCSTSYYNSATITGVWSPDFSNSQNVTIAN